VFLLIYKIFKRGFLHDSKRADTLEESKKEFAERIESLEMSLAFAESNAGVDVTRIQRLEEQFDDLSNKVEHMQSKLCTCGGKVRVFLL